MIFFAFTRNAALRRKHKDLKESKMRNLTINTAHWFVSGEQTKANSGKSNKYDLPIKHNFFYKL